MAEFKSHRELLEQIRDLLQPIAAVYRPQYEELVRKRKKEQIESILEIVGRGVKRAAACKLMDGSRSRKEIAQLSKIDSGELSRLTKALKEGDLVVENDGRPSLVVEAGIVWSE